MPETIERMTPMPLGRVERSATFAFCPKECADQGNSAMGYLGLGTMAGAFDMSFSTNATVELFSLDPNASTAKPSNILEKAGSDAESHERFHRLVWGALPATGSDYPLGVIAGGLVDGSVNLFNPQKLFSPNSGPESSALICPLKKHRGAVKGLQFNPFSGNLLASGGEDGDVCIWDIANPTKPTLFPALKDSGMQKGEITALSWNHKVQHILASTTSSGSTIVWDLKRQRQVISFSDSSGGNMGKRCSALQWHPEIATQLIVASDDDRFPVLQVWDLRNSISPCREFRGHDKGVLSLAWSTLDSSLLLSTGKDNRTLLWDAHAGEILSEMPRSQNWNFDAQWCPTVPGWFATSSFDGVVSVYDVVQGMGASQGATDEGSAAGGEYDFGAQHQQQQAGLNQAVAKRAPKWMGRPCGAAFGFGGKVISFSKAQAAPGGSSSGAQPGPSTSKVTIASVPGDDSLVSYATELTSLISECTKDTMVAFCEKKGAAGQEKELWDFMRILFEGDTRKLLLEHLGFKPPEPKEPPIAAEAQQANGLVTAAGNLSLDGNLDEINQQLAQPEPAEAFNDEDFFDNLQGVPSPLPSPVKKEEPEVPQEAEAPPPAAKEAQQEPPESLDPVDREIKHALFVGNYEGAVDVCLGAGKMADALLIASVGGADLWAKTQKAYVKQNSKGYMKVLLSIMENDLKALVEHQHPQSWRETLALVCTYSQSEEWADLCSNLGDLLLTRGGDIDSAVLCYICAGNLDSAVRLWSQSIDLAQDKTQLHSVMEKSIVLSLATEHQGSQAYGDLLNMYADLLASNGQINEALSFLNSIPGELSESTTILRDRLSQAGARLEAADQAAATTTAASVGSQDYATQDYSQQGYGGQQQGYVDPASQQQQASYSSYQDQSYSNYQATPQYSQPVSYNQPTYGGGSGGYGQSQGYYQQQPAAVPSQPSAYDQQYQQQQQQGGYGQQQQQAYAPSQGAAPISAAPPAQPTLFNPMAATPAPAAAAQQPQQMNMFTPQSAVQGRPSAAPQSQSGAPKAETKPSAPQAPANISIATADVSKVATDLKPAVSCLIESYNICAKAYEGNPGKKREVDDNSRRIGILFFKLNIGDVKPSVRAQLLDLCRALAARDFASASKIHISLTTTDFDECGQWLTALKRIIKTRQTLGQ